MTEMTEMTDEEEHPLDSQAPRPKRGFRGFFFRKKVILVTLLSLGLIGIAWFIPPVYWLIDGPVIVTRYTKKDGETRTLVGPQEKGWTPYAKMSRHFVNAVVASEDGKFFQHRGLDLGEIQRSYEINKKKNRYVRGGSTITQQVVKMAFLDREKTIIRKAREAIGALILENLLSKEGILEWYLNLVELGDGVYGIAAGSQHYFRTKPELLTIEQSIHLALVLPSPNAWSKGLRQKNLTKFGHRRYGLILKRMRQSGYVTSTQWTAAVTRGNFGRPIDGYASLLAQEDALQKDQGDDDRCSVPGGSCDEDEEGADEDGDGFVGNAPKGTVPPLPVAPVKDPVLKLPPVNEPSVKVPPVKEPPVKEPPVKELPMKEPLFKEPLYQEPPSTLPKAQEKPVEAQLLEAPQKESF